MTKAVLLSAALSLALPAPAQAPAASDATGFALALHREVAGGANVMTSPHSLRQALGMAYAGSAGATRSQMALVLRAGPAFEAEEKAGRASLAAADGPATLKIANALFVKEGYALLPGFLRTVKDAFGAEVFVRKFGPAAAAEINGWASKATNGKIPSIIEELEERDRAVLLNAVYFKGRWAVQFPKEKTAGRSKSRRGGASGGPHPETFRPTGKKPFALKLMSVHETFDYAEEPGAWQAVRLPYKGGRLAMIVALPAETSSAAAFRETLDGAAWRSLRLALRRRRPGFVALPKFTFSETHDMIAPLRELGMKLAFDRENSDFSGISKPASKAEELYFSKVVQKTFVAVDEEGTEAAAVTSAIASARGSRKREEEPFSFVANRPFLFAIEDSDSGTILFIGEVHDPR